MDIRIGSPATGQNFYPRPALIRSLVRALRRSHVAFVGPRRTGKTSCLHAISGSPPTGYVAVMMNLEKHDTIAAWMAEMLAKVREQLTKPFSEAASLMQQAGKLLKRIEEIQLLGAKIKLAPKADSWRPVADEFLGLLKEADPPLLFLLDEFPAFLILVARKSSREEVEEALHWFRAARHDLVDRNPRFLVTGSIGLKSVVRRLGLDPTINDFDTREIPPLEDDEALGLLGQLSRDNGLGLNDRRCKEILRLLGANWPILLQLFISEIQDASPNQSITAADLQRLYRERLVGGSRNEYCAGMHSRLKQAFGESECRLAHAILRSLCRSKMGLTREEFEAIQARLTPEPSHRALISDELDCVLEALKHDGYLLQAGDGEQRTQFASNILRDYWIRKTS